jgi:ribose transport system ATP-binding protein
MGIKKKLLEVRNLSKDYPGVHALKNIDFNLSPGEIRGLVGENGAGKSTFVKILGGVVRADNSEIVLDGNIVNISNPNKALDLGIAVVHQERSLFPNLSVATNIYFSEIDSNNLIFIPEAKINEKSRTILSEFGLGNVSPTTCVSDLDPGQQQLVEIARATIKNARIIIFDEPTSSLSSNETEILFQIMRNLKKKNVAIIFISHRLDEVFELCDSVTVFRDGCHIITTSPEKITNSDLVELILGREEEEMYKRATKRKFGESLLEVRDLMIQPKIENISFTLHEGEILGIAGLLGSGRTEIAKAIFGLEKPDKGQILIKNKLVSISNPKEAIKLGMGFITEDRHSEGLILKKSIKDNLVLSNLKSYSNIFGWMIQKKEISAANRQKDSLNIITPSIFRKVKFLSGGNQQKVVLGKWLETQPNIFILDDPTRGIDVGTKAEFYKIIYKLADRGAGILFISSELQEVASVCDRVVVIRNGRAKAEFFGNEINMAKILVNMTGD